MEEGLWHVREGRARSDRTGTWSHCSVCHWAIIYFPAQGTDIIDGPDASALDLLLNTERPLIRIGIPELLRGRPPNGLERGGSGVTTVESCQRILGGDDGGWSQPGLVVQVCYQGAGSEEPAVLVLGGLFDSRPVIVCAAIAAMHNRAWTKGVRSADSWLNVGKVRKEELGLAGNDHVCRQGSTGQARCELCRTARRRLLLNNIDAPVEVEDVVVIAQNIICHGND